MCIPPWGRTKNWDLFQLCVISACSSSSCHQDHIRSGLPPRHMTGQGMHVLLLFFHSKAEILTCWNTRRCAAATLPQGSAAYLACAEGPCWPHTVELELPGSPCPSPAPTARAAAFAWPLCLPSSLFSLHCVPPTLCTVVLSHTAPCVLSQGARAGNLQTASLPTLETQPPGAVRWATFPVSPRPVTRCSSQLQKHQWSESARTEMLPFLHKAWGEAVLKHPWSALTFLWEASSEEVSVVWYRERRMSSHHAACRAQQKPRLSVLAFPLQRCRHSDPQPLSKANKSREGRTIVRSRWSPNAAHHYCVWCLDFLSSMQDN